MPSPIEFWVESKNIHGAAIIANKRVKEMNEDWIISTIYWLDPNYFKDEGE